MPISVVAAVLLLATCLALRTFVVGYLVLVGVELWIEYAGAAGLEFPVSKSRMVFSLCALSLLALRSRLARRVSLGTWFVACVSVMGYLQFHGSSIALGRWISCIFALGASLAWAGCAARSRWFVPSSSLVVVLLAVAGVVEYLRRQPILMTPYFAPGSGFRSASMFAHPLVFGWAMVLAVPLVYRLESRPLRVVSMVAVGCSIVVSGSRSAIGVAVVAGAIALIRTRSLSTFVRRGTILALVGGVAVFATGLAQEVQVRVESGSAEVNRSEAWSLAPSSLEGAALLFGNGPGYVAQASGSGESIFSEATSVAAFDNQWLTLLAEMGPLAVAAAMWIALRFVRSSWRLRRAENLYLALAVVGAGLAFDALYWPIIGAVAASSLFSRTRSEVGEGVRHLSGADGDNSLVPRKDSLIVDR